MPKKSLVERPLAERSSSARGSGLNGGGDRRAQVVDIAARLFRAQGYDATSLQDLADAVGIQKGSIYHYIETKEDLLFEIIQTVHERTEGGNTAWRDVEGSALSKVRAFVEGHVRVSVDNLEYAEVFFRDSRALSASRSAQIIEARDRYEATLKKLVAAAIKEGSTRPGIDASLATRVIFGMINWIYLWYRADGPLSVDQLVKQLGDFAVASLAEVPAGAGQPKRGK